LRAAGTTVTLPPRPPTDDDWLFDSLPEYREAAGLSCDVGAGEAIYIPTGWHHALLSGNDPELCAHAAINHWFADFGTAAQNKNTLYQQAGRFYSSHPQSGVPETTSGRKAKAKGKAKGKRRKA
jgi:hypothetical protein